MLWNASLLVLCSDNVYQTHALQDFLCSVCEQSRNLLLRMITSRWVVFADLEIKLNNHPSSSRVMGGFLKWNPTQRKYLERSTKLQWRRNIIPRLSTGTPKLSPVYAHVSVKELNTRAPTIQTLGCWCMVASGLYVLSLDQPTQSHLTCLPGWKVSTPFTL